MPEGVLPDYDDFLKQRDTERRLMIGNQLDVDVTEAQRVLKLRGQTGLPHEVIANDLDYIEQQSRLQEFDPKKYRDTNPKYAKFAADNPFDLAILKDDEPNMTRTEWVLDALFDWSSVGMAVKSSYANREIGMIGDRQRELGGPQEGDAEKLKELNKYAVDHDFDTSGLKSLVVAGFQQSANMLGAYEHGLHRAKYYGPAGAALGQMYGAAGGTFALPGGGTAVGAGAGAVGGYGIGFGIGMITGSYEYSEKLEGGHAYLEYRELGFTHKDAAWAASIAGPIAGTLEAIGGNIIFSKLPGVRMLKGTVGDEIVKQLMGRTTFRQVAGKAARDWGAAQAGEVTTEIGQEVTTIVMGEILKAQNNREDMLSREEWIDRIVGITTMTLKSTVLLAGLGPGQRLIMDGKRARDAKGRMLAFNALAEASKDSKVRQKVPGKYREFVESVTEDGGIEHILINSEHFDTYFQGQGLDPDEMAAELGIDKDNLESARELGTKVEIPVGAYAEKIAPTDHHAGLGPDIQTREGDMTYRQSEEFESIRGELEKEIQELAAPTDDKSSEEQQRMLKDITAQLVAANTEPGLAQEQAMIMVGFINLDKKMGYEPGTLLTRMFAGVRKDAPEGLQGTDSDIRIDPLLNKLREGEFPTQREMMGASLMELIAESGGIDLKDSELTSRDFETAARDMGVSKAELNRWRKEGLSIDAIAELAAESGYIAEGDENLLLEAIDAEIRGEPIYGTGSPGDPRLQELSRKLDELSSFIQAENIDLATLNNAEVRALLEAGDKFDQIDFDALKERMESRDLAQMMTGMPQIIDQQDFGDVAFTDTVRVKETGELADMTTPAQIIFDDAVQRRNGLRKLLGCVSG